MKLKKHFLFFTVSLVILSGCTTQNEITQEETAQSKVTIENQIEKEKTNKLENQEYINPIIIHYPEINTTEMISTLDLEALLNEELTLESKTPTILITTTHSREIYKDGKNITTLAEKLASLLEETYDVQTICLKTESELVTSFAEMEVEVQKVLKEKPDIQFMIDLHRDGSSVDTSISLNGQTVAPILLINGLCVDPEIGTIGSSKAYHNPYMNENLTISLKVKEQADKTFPDLIKPIALSAYCLNQNLVPYAMHVEVGSNRNTFDEAERSIEAFSTILGETLDLKKK